MDFSFRPRHQQPDRFSFRRGLKRVLHQIFKNQNHQIGVTVGQQPFGIQLVV